MWKLGCNGDGEGARVFENGAMRGVREREIEWKRPAKKIKRSSNF